MNFGECTYVHTFFFLILDSALPTHFSFFKSCIIIIIIGDKDVSQKKRYDWIYEVMNTAK